MFKYSYKILRPIEAVQLNFYGLFSGNSKDIINGYIHLCKNEEQLKKIIIKNYICEPITIIKIDNSKTTKLKYEKATDGDEYPHLYDNITNNIIINRLLLDSNINDNTGYYKILNNLNEHMR